MLSENIDIRPATTEDVEQLWPLVTEFASSYRPESRAFAQSFTDLVGRSDTLIMVGVANTSAIVGYLLGSYHGTFFANAPVAWIEELMVSETARSQGVATKLMASAEQWARSIPAAHIAVASRRAGDFYVRIGYEESATYYRKTLVPLCGELSTYPSVPLTRIRCPSQISLVACSTPTTAGKPYSRAMTAPWVIRPPTSVTRPLIATNAGVQLGSV